MGVSGCPSSFGVYSLLVDSAVLSAGFCEGGGRSDFRPVGVETWVRVGHELSGSLWWRQFVWVSSPSTLRLDHGWWLVKEVDLLTGGLGLTPVEIGLWIPQILLPSFVCRFPIVALLFLCLSLAPTIDIYRLRSTRNQWRSLLSLVPCPARDWSKVVQELKIALQIRRHASRLYLSDLRSLVQNPWAYLFFED